MKRAKGWLTMAAAGELTTWKLRLFRKTFIIDLLWSRTGLINEYVKPAIACEWYEAQHRLWNLRKPDVKLIIIL